MSHSSLIHMDLSQIPAGAVFLYNPFATVMWCYRNKVWPTLITYLHIAMACIYYVVTRDRYSHVLQYIGDEKFVHTRMGQVRLDRAENFPPGYLETSGIVIPKNPNSFDEHVKKEFEKAVGRKNPDATTIPLAGPFRWLHSWNVVGKFFRGNYSSCNCTAFVAWNWWRGGRDILKDEKLCFVGIYPGDYMKMKFFEIYRR